MADERAARIAEFIEPLRVRPGRRVNLARDFDPRASYTTFDTETATFEFKRVEYDVKAAASKILSSDLEPNFGTRLFLGI